MTLLHPQERQTIGLNKQQAWEIIQQVGTDEIIAQFAKEDPLLWIYQHVPTEYGTKLSFEQRPYLVDILRDFSPHIVYKKSAQVGITMCGGIAKTLYAADVLGLTSIYTFPTARDVGEFSKARFRYIMRNSAYLNSRVEVDNEGMVRVGNSVVYFRGTWTDRQAMSVPSMLNVHDELDASKPNVREIYSSRLDAAQFMYKGELQRGWEWDFSTPSLPSFGVSALYDISDQKEWYVRCDGCKRRQRVNFFKNLRSRGRGQKKTYYFGCLKCDKELDRGKGWWEAKNPGARISGYHITQPMCAFIDPTKMAHTFELARKTSDGIKKFYNFNLGLEYEDSTEVVTRSLVLNKVVEGTVWEGPIFIGVDQGNILHVVVAKLLDGKRHYIWFGTLNSFEELSQLIEHYKPRVCVIDGLPNTHNARDLAKRHYSVYNAYYGGNKKLERHHWEKDLENKEVKVPRTDVLDKTAYSWNIGDVVIEDTIPRSLIEEFAEQMSNAKRTIEEKPSGEEVAVWVAVGDDHYRHADTYCWMALEIGTARWNNTFQMSKPDANLFMNEQLFTESEIW